MTRTNQDREAAVVAQAIIDEGVPPEAREERAAEIRQLIRHEDGRRRVADLARATRESDLSLDERRANAYGEATR